MNKSQENYSSNRQHEKIVFNDYEDLVSRRIINGLIDLRDVKLTENQLEQLRKYVRCNDIWYLIVKKLDSEDLTIVENANESSLIYS